MLPRHAPYHNDANYKLQVVESIWTPGTNTGLIKAMNASFYALFATLLIMLFLTSGNGHVWALLGLSLGLFASIKWCVSPITCRWGKAILRRASLQGFLFKSRTSRSHGGWTASRRRLKSVRREGRRSDWCREPVAGSRARMPGVEYTRCAFIPTTGRH